MKPFFGRVFRYFLQGLLFTAPLALTVYALWWMFSFVDDLLLDHITRLIGFRIPGLGLLVVAVIVTVIGLLGSTIVFNPVMNYFDRLLIRTPVIKILYSSFKDFFAAFVGKEKKFTEPVLVRFSKDADMEKIGFVTAKDLSQIGIGNGKVAVYFPYSYTFTGTLFIVPTENIRPLHASPTEVMKFLVSAGVTSIHGKASDINQPEDGGINSIESITDKH
ncbi:MAG TPA: DUF502 domain-containing protein [Bacteroidales bacterium]|nr:DUF502 domain-containing protein [Bacteroidales bacterium]